MVLARTVTSIKPADLKPPAPEVEKRLEELQSRLSPEARRTLTSRLAKPQAFDGLTPAPLAAALPRPARPATARVSPDPAKARRDLERAQATCNAFGRKVPGAPNACASVPQ